jgi:hypothetical protein
MATSPATTSTAVRMPRTPLPPNSVFALAGGKATAADAKASEAPATAATSKPAVKRGGGSGPKLPPDLAAVVIRKGMPIPPAQHGSSASIYADLYARLEKGDMVELTSAQAKSFYAWSKAKKRGLVIRQLGDGKHGCWRTE